MVCAAVVSADRAFSRGVPLDTVLHNELGPPGEEAVQEDCQSLPVNSSNAAFSKHKIPGVQPRFWYQGVPFASLSEAGCAHLLTRWIDGYRIIPGETYQVPVGPSRAVDFRVSDVLIEYHHLRFYSERRRCGDFPSADARFEYRRRARALRRHSRAYQELVRSTREVLRSTYAERRKRHLSQYALPGTTELVITTNLEEFYHQVLLRFTPRGHSPSFSEVEARFRDIIRAVSRETQLLKKLRRREPGRLSQKL